MDEDDAGWQAILSRDHAARERFVFGVASTGIYCRPGCPARTPLRRNIRVLAGTVEARAAGYRACLRCAPDRPG